MVAKAAKLADRVTAGLRAEIRTCRRMPGTKLRMGDIVERYGVSLGAVREALSSLAAEGVVVAEPQKGFRVAPVSLDELRDLTRTRIDVESLCLARAIETGGLAWRTRVVGAAYALEQTDQYEAPATGDGPPTLAEGWSIAHREFHEALVSGCASPILLGVRADLYRRSERYRYLSVPLDSRERDVGAEHRAIAEAVLVGDSAASCRLMAAHLQTTTRIILASADRLGDVFDDPDEVAAAGS